LREREKERERKREREREREKERGEQVSTILLNISHLHTRWAPQAMQRVLTACPQEESAAAINVFRGFAQCALP